MLQHGKHPFYSDEFKTYFLNVDGAHFNFKETDDIISIIDKVQEKYKGADVNINITDEFHTRFGPLDLIMTIDAIHGNQLVEFETTHNFKHEDYRTSLKWQLYLLCTDLDVINYEVVEMSAKPILHQFSFHRNDIDESYIHSTIDQMLDHLEAHKLLGFIK